MCLCNWTELARRGIRAITVFKMWQFQLDLAPAETGNQPHPGWNRQSNQKSLALLSGVKDASRYWSKVSENGKRAIFAWLDVYSAVDRRVWSPSVDTGSSGGGLWRHAAQAHGALCLTPGRDVIRPYLVISPSHQSSEFEYFQEASHFEHRAAK